MWLYILLALFNGVIIGLSRVLNGQLSHSKGPFQASFYNHIIGFGLLTVLLLLINPNQMLATTNNFTALPSYIYLGGFIGALYVAINSYVLGKIGASSCAILVISGQMFTGVIIDIWLDTEVNSTVFSYQLLLQFSAVALIIMGIFLSNKYSD